MKSLFHGHSMGGSRLLAIALSTGLSLTTIATLAQEKNMEEKKMRRDLDKEIEQLERAKANVQALSQKNWKKAQEACVKAKLDMNFDKMQKDMEMAFRKVDFDAIQHSIESAISQYRAQADEELVEEEALKRMKEELEKAKEEHGKAMKAQQQAIQYQVEKAKKQAEEASSLKLEKLNLEKTFNQAQEGIDKAKAALKAYQEMIYSMEAEGLLDTKKDYTIHYDGTTLMIDGKEQAANVTEKYKKYFTKTPVTLKKSGGVFVGPHEE